MGSEFKRRKLSSFLPPPPPNVRPGDSLIQSKPGHSLVHTNTYILQRDACTLPTCSEKSPGSACSDSKSKPCSFGSSVSVTTTASMQIPPWIYVGKDEGRAGEDSAGLQTQVEVDPCVRRLC